MGTQCVSNYSLVLFAQTIFIILFMFPDFSPVLWRSLVKKWSLAEQKRTMKRKSAADEKLKRYWEIDMRKFK